MKFYSNSREFSIQPGCPWYKAQQTYGPPNLKWCEATQCAYINEPANTWSNLGYLLVPFLIYFLYKSKFKGHASLKRFTLHWGISVFLMGLASFVYHATNNAFTQIFDFVGMFLMINIPIAINLQRIRGIDPKTYPQFWSWLFAVDLLVFQCFGFLDIPIQHTVGINVLIILGTEIIAQMKERTSAHTNFKSSLRYFWLSLVVMALAQFFSQLDLKRIWCEPDNLILHGHALWHVFGAVGMFTIYLHYRQFVEK